MDNRAERRGGEILGETVKVGNPQLSHDATISLSNIGITRSTSSRWGNLSRLIRFVLMAICLLILLTAWPGKGKAPASTTGAYVEHEARVMFQVNYHSEFRKSTHFLRHKKIFRYR